MIKIVSLLSLLLTFSLNAAELAEVSDGEQIKAATLNEVIAKVNLLEKQTVRTGSVIIMPGACPLDYRLANGDSLSRTDYPKLFEAIGTAHGFPSASTFNLPDYRGRFLRAADAGSGNDPDSSTRTAMNPGGASGSSVGSIQGDQNKEHSHTLYRRGNPDGGAYDPGDGQRYESSAATTDRAIVGTFSVSSSGGLESRPKNAYVNFCIKVK